MLKNKHFCKNLISIAVYLTILLILIPYSSTQSSNQYNFLKSQEPKKDIIQIVKSEPIKISNNDSFMSFYPEITVDGNNNVYVVWVEDELFSMEIHSRKLNYANNTWLIEQEITESNNINSIFPQITHDKNNRVHFAWRESGTDKYLAYRYMEENTLSQIYNVSRNNITTNSIEIESDNNGNIIFIWNDDFLASQQLFYRNYSLGSDMWSEIIQVTNSSGHSQVPSLLIDPENLLHLTWTSKTDNIIVTETFYQKIDSNQWHTSQPTLVSQNDGNSSMIPKLAIDSKNNLFALWSEVEDLKGITKIRVLDNNEWTNSITIEDINTLISWDMKLDGNNNLHLVWVDNNLLRYKGITRCQYWTESITLLNRENQLSDPRFDIDKNGNIYLIWNEYFDSSWEIFYMQCNITYNNPLSLFTIIVISSSISLVSIIIAVIIYRQIKKR